jgi:transposase
MIKISEQEYERIKEAAKKNKNKRVDKKLQVLIMRHENKGNEEISARTGYNVRYITTLMGQYKKQGLEEFIRIKQTSHNRNMSVEQEAKVLAKFEEEADAGHELTVNEIRQGLESELGKETSVAYAYRVLKRHGWRKVMPRPKHPKAAGKEEQDSSKKLKSITTE